MYRGNTEPELQRSDFSMELQRTLTLPITTKSCDIDASLDSSIAAVSYEDPISDLDVSLDEDFIPQIRNSISSSGTSMLNTSTSVFTPVRKRERQPSLSPADSLKKSLRFDSTESSPYISRNTSSLMDECNLYEKRLYIVEFIPLSATQDLIVLNDCPTVFNSYEKDFVTIKHIGEGSFTLVDLVQCVSNNLSYAIKRSKSKMTKPSERRSFLKEIRIFMEVSECPNLLHYYKSWQEDSFLYTLMESCTRGNLVTLIEIPIVIPENIIWYILYSVLQTLDYLHDHSIIHCDIKPENLLITELGSLRVGDLGSATHINEVGNVCDLRYLSQEGLEDEFTPRRDIFSLGLVIYQLMSKEELPISGDRWTSLRHGGIKVVKGYSKTLNTCVHKMTALKDRPSAFSLLQQIPESVKNNEAECRSFIRTHVVSVFETVKKRSKKPINIKINDKYDYKEDRSATTTPIDLVHSAYSLKFNF